MPVWLFGEIFEYSLSPSSSTSFLLQDKKIKSSHDVLTEDPKLSSQPALDAEELRWHTCKRKISHVWLDSPHTSICKGCQPCMSVVQNSFDVGDWKLWCGHRPRPSGAPWFLLLGRIDFVGWDTVQLLCGILWLCSIPKCNPQTLWTYQQYLRHPSSVRGVEC